MDRRGFIKTCAVLSAGSACAYGLPLLTTYESGANEAGPSTKRKWGMVVDLNKCLEGCNACVEACRKENNVALHGNPDWDIYWIRKVTVKRESPVNSPERSVPLLCNHCDEPPCAQVCPVQATYKREDGIVIVDKHRCIGCRYCMIACPYSVRFFNYKENPDWPNESYPKRSHGVAESCNFCAHLLDAGKRPACVEACEGVNAGALRLGNLNDPDSDVSKLISSNSVKRLREGLGTEPKVYYIGL